MRFLTYFRQFTRRTLSLSLCGLALSTSPVLAQTATSDEAVEQWPSRDIHLIVPFGAGSTPDQVARIVAAEASKTLGQTIVIDNKVGAGGNIGTAAIARAKPDGYTFGISINGPLVYNQFIFNELGYHPERDLAPLTLAVTQPNVIVANNTLNINTLEELITAIKSNPDKYNFAIPGTGSGSHLSMELLLKAIGGRATAIPYPSSPAAINSLLAGDTQFTALAPIAVVPLAQDGRLKILAQTSDKPNSTLPNVPTVSSTGVAQIDSQAWSGFVISSKVPEAIRAKLHKALFDALQNPQVVELIKAQYMDPIPSTPENFTAYMLEEKKRWQPLIESLDLKK